MKHLRFHILLMMLTTGLLCSAAISHITPPPLEPESADLQRVRAIESIEKSDTLQLRVYYRQGNADLDMNYRDNARTLAEFASKLRQISKDPDAVISSLVIAASASPEGTTSGNKRLSENRCKALQQYLLTNTSIKVEQITLQPMGEDWEGLKTQLRARCQEEWRDKAIDIIDNTPLLIYDANGTPIDGRRRQLQNLAGGNAWWWMNDNIFPDLRQAGSAVQCVVQHGKDIAATASKYTPEEWAAIVAQAEALRAAGGAGNGAGAGNGGDAAGAGQAGQAGGRDTLIIIHRDTVYLVPQKETTVIHVHDGKGDVPQTVEDSLRALRRAQRAEARAYQDSLLRHTAFVVRSNTFCPFTNIGIEFPINKHFSIAGDFYTPWALRVKSHEWAFQLQAADVEARYWFGRRFRGHSIGVVAEAGQWDFELPFQKREGMYASGRQGEFYGGGLSYTYACPIFKGRMHLEFDLTGGFLKMESRPYDVYGEGGKLIHRDGLVTYTNWIGPTRAGVTLAVPVRTSILKGYKENQYQKQEARKAARKSARLSRAQEVAQVSSAKQALASSAKEGKEAKK